MTWWKRLWYGPSNASTSNPIRLTDLAMEGWLEDEPSGELRVWRSPQQDVLSLAVVQESLVLPSFNDMVGLQQWCRDIAEDREAGLIEVRAGTGRLGPTVSLIYKRLEMPAYIFTGMLFVPSDEISWIWTVISGERGTTGVREAIVTAELMNEGRLTIEDYKRFWAQDPYDSNYRGVDRSVLRFTSDDEGYDKQFPEHPLSKVRQVLTALPNCVRIASSPSEDQRHTSA